MGDLKAALLDLERQGWNSLCEGTGGEFYRELMTPDALMVLANGAVMDRESVVHALEQAPPWRTYEIDDVRVIHNGSNCATLVYVGRGYREGDEPAFVGVMSSVYLRDDDAWRLAFYQQTPIPTDD